MTLAIQTSNESIVKVTIEDVRKGDILAYAQDTTRKAKITEIEFKMWGQKKVAFYTFLDLQTLQTRSHSFIDITTVVNKVLGYENIEEKSLRCCQCNKQLAKATFKGLILIKCTKCKTVNEFTN